MASRSVSTDLICSSVSSSRSSSRQSVPSNARAADDHHRSGVPQAAPSFAQQGLIVGDALGEEQSLDPIDVLYPLRCQGLALATDPAAILLVRGRCSNHGAHPRLASLIRQQALTRASPSILSVFALRRRRDVAIEAGSTTWLSTPSSCSNRWIQNPSRPASCITMIGTTWPMRTCAFSVSRENRARSPATSPLRTVCFDIFSPPPGDNDVISQVDRLSSNETKIAPRSVRIAVGA